MSQTTSELISAIVSGNAIGTENSFGAAMAEKLAGKLDAMRQDIAQNMFVSEEETENELVAEDLEWISEEEYLQLSEEEQEDYVTEEQLDELMGKGSVGAVKDMHNDAAYTGKRTKRSDFHATQAQRASHIKSKIDTRAQHGKDAQHYHQYGYDSKRAKAQHAALSADAKKKVAKTSGAEYTGKDKGPGIATKGKTTISNPRTASQSKDDDAKRIK
jgi:hypothetical protein